MATSKSLLKAKDKYRKAHTKSVCIQFFPADMYLYEFLSEQGAKATYIKELIRKDYEAKKDNR